MEEFEVQSLNAYIRQLAGGETEALDRIYGLTAGRLLAVAVGIVHARAAAEDVLHDSYIKLARSADSFRGGNGYAWLCRIVRNTAFNYLKSERYRRGDNIDDFFELADSGNLGESSALRLSVEAAMKDLSRRERNMIYLRYFADKTVRQIAKDMDEPKSTVMSVLKKAEERLKELLKT